MDSNSPRLLTPIAKVRGLGSAKDGTEHWLWQRITAMVLLVLVPWLVWSLLTHVLGDDRAGVAEWIASPLVCITLLVLFTAMFYHAKLGLQVVIEDYMHCACMKTASLIGIKILFPILTLICWVSVLKLHFTGV